jgi:hypothetical protein
MRSPRRSGPGCCSDPVPHRSGRTRRRRHPAPPGSLFRPVAPLSAVTRTNPLRVSTGRGRIERPRPSSATSRRPGTTTTHQRSHPVAVTLRPKAPVDRQRRPPGARPVVATLRPKAPVRPATPTIGSTAGLRHPPDRMPPVRPATPTTRKRDRPPPPPHQGWPSTSPTREHGQSPPPSTECPGLMATPTARERDRSPPPFHQTPCPVVNSAQPEVAAIHPRPPTERRGPTGTAVHVAGGAAVPGGSGGGATRGCPVRRGPRCRRPAGGVGVGPGAGRAEGLQRGSRWWTGPGPGWDQRWIRSR